MNALDAANELHHLAWLLKALEYSIEYASDRGDIPGREALRLEYSAATKRHAEVTNKLSEVELK